MITKLKLHNWKSFEDATLYIDPLTFLIGTNASGKSNVLDAFEFLRLRLNGVPLENAINQIRGGEDWIIQKGKSNCSIEIYAEENGNDYCFVSEIIRDENGFHELNPAFEVLENTPNNAPLSALSVIKNYINRVFILDPIPNRMRQYSKISKQLFKDGSNIAGVMAGLKDDEKKELEEKLTKYIGPLPERDINKMEAVKVGLTNTDAMLYCYEDWNPQVPVDARGMSDGTLRFAAIVVAMLTAKPHSLLIIEEVDNGLHPSRAKELVKVLKEISHDRSVDVLCTTHNPVLINELGNDMIPFVSYVVRDEKGNSSIRLLEDKDNLAKLMASGTVGDLMIMDKL